jgi:hypothetical protein
MPFVVPAHALDVRWKDEWTGVGQAAVLDDLKTITVCDWAKDEVRVRARIGNQNAEIPDDYWELEAPQGGCVRRELEFTKPATRIRWARLCAYLVADRGWEAVCRRPARP